VQARLMATFPRPQRRAGFAFWLPLIEGLVRTSYVNGALALFQNKRPGSEPGLVGYYTTHTKRGGYGHHPRPVPIKL
jgi:hypothetical protein